MEEKEFNLLKEPWIRVMKSDLTVQEVSLTDALTHAQEYRALSGEMPTQDAAILRLLLACAQTIFYRYDAEGEEDPVDQEWEASYILDRWKAYRNLGHFPEAAVRHYLESYEDRFWLFHPKTPFFQVAGLSYGTDYGAQGLLGNLKSSNNQKTRHHFSMNEGPGIQKMSYSEAARWLVTLNGYCVNIKNNKKAQGTTAAAGVGRLGGLGLVYVDADNLFDILLKNLTPLTRLNDPWGDPNPIWEQPVRDQQSISVAAPDNLPERYTLQSRRMLLCRKDEMVTGVRVMNGDFFGYEDDFDEPMTLWSKTKKGNRKDSPIVYMPKRHRPEVQLWREFSSIFITDEKSRMPGVVMWVNQLYANNLISRKKLITFRAVGLQYGKDSYIYGDCLNDGLSLSSDFLSEFSRDWISLIRDEIVKCTQVVDTAIKPFAGKIAEILNLTSPDRLIRNLSEEFYSDIDTPFREWLADIRPQEDRKDSAAAKWESIAYQTAREIVQEQVESFGEDLFVFRESGAEVLSIPQAYNQYLWRIQGIYKKTQGQEGKE